MSAPPLVIVALSGGVDSSVAAHLLLQQGMRVEGLFMSNWEEDEDGYCTTAQDYQDALQVCRLLNITLHKVSFAKEYRERVFKLFLSEYQAGRTPNPDVLCNREIKFGVCFEHAMRLGADFIATGHYARVTHNPERLLRAVDQNKDQSYFLHALQPAALAKTIFPLGELNKEQVRALAKQLTLPTHDKKDSTGICFIGERPFAAFLAQYLPAQPGPIVTLSGEHLGQHRGLMYYTLGQRQGLHIGGTATHPGLAWYVAAKDLANNTLIVVQGNDHPALQQTGLIATAFNWIHTAQPTEPLHCTAKTRYRQPDQACTVQPLQDDCYRITFEQPQRAITPGQYVVLYADDVCLGGGVITQTTAA